jgi:hypothetical protein
LAQTIKKAEVTQRQIHIYTYLFTKAINSGQYNGAKREILQAIRIKDTVSQNVFFAVLSCATAFLIILTRFKQNIIQKIGMKFSAIKVKNWYIYLSTFL